MHGKSNFLQPHGLQPTRLLCPWDYPSKDTGVGFHLYTHTHTHTHTHILLCCIYLKLMEYCKSTTLIWKRYPPQKSSHIFPWVGGLLYNYWSSFNERKKGQNEPGTISQGLCRGLQTQILGLSAGSVVLQPLSTRGVLMALKSSFVYCPGNAAST